MLIFTLSVYKSQARQDNAQIKDLIENLAERLPEDYDLSELTERLNHYIRHPIDLNKASQEELNGLLLLSPLQVSNLFNHLAKSGKLLDILELQGIDGFDMETINRLMPFVTVKTSAPLSATPINTMIKKGNNDLIVRYGQVFQTQKGFKELPGSRYLGSPEKLLLRYRYSYADFLSASLVTEKDAGEYLFHGKAGADHISGNIAVFNTGRIKKLVIGDYSLQFGQGLTLWSGFAFGKGPDVTSVASKDTGLRPYASSNEASFFRGAAGTINLFKNIDLSTFASFRKLDASLKYPSEGGPTLQNINISGLHRTPNELKIRKDLGQQVYGGILQYVSSNLHMGFAGYQSVYQHEFVTGTQLYNKYGYTGKRLLNTGFYYNYTYRNIYFYGEAAHSFGGGWAVVNGAMASISAKVSAVLLYRNYDKDYHNFFSNGVGEATEINNEKGWYAGLNYTPVRQWTFSAYGDYFRFPWLRYRVDSASSGYEILTQATYTRNKTFKVIARYKREVKQQNPDAGSEYNHLEKVIKQSGRIACNWQLNRQFNFQHRAELSFYQKGRASTETGYLVYQDLNYHPLSSRLSGNMRLAYFSTPSYNSRIYAYEDDVLYSSGSGNYHDTGIRYFVNLRYRLMRKMDVWARYAIYIYQDLETIGSALDEIEGNKKSDIKIQFRYQF